MKKVETVQNPVSRSDNKTILVTGSSSGIGQAVCNHLAKNGHQVFGASRTPVEAANWTHLTVDVTNDASVEELVARVNENAGGIDTLVHCAGVSIAGSLEDTSVEEAKLLFDTNYFGAVRMAQAILPFMRAQGFGQIMLIGSIGGLIGLPFIGHYSASKFALDGFMQALRSEIQPFGVEATVIHPGDFRTSIAQNQSMANKANDDTSAYKDTCPRVVDLYTKSVEAAPEPQAIAQLIEKLLDRKLLAPNYIVGS